MIWKNKPSTKNTPTSSIGVIYLARQSEGVEAFRSFIQSFAAHSSGIPHDLIVIFKGFSNRNDLNAAQSEFASFTHIPIELPDEGLDIGSYFEAAKFLHHSYICCLNTFSRILSDDWLEKLYSHAILPDVGIVGATGSYEGLHDSTLFFQKAIWLNSQPGIDVKLRLNLNKYFQFIFQYVFPKIKDNLRVIDPIKLQILTKTICKSTYRKFRSLIFAKKESNELEKNFYQWWESIQNKGDIAQFCKFPSFPNPHIRTNAFMIDRKRFLSFNTFSILNKMDACGVESGYEGMTRRLLREGLKARIVGKNGKGYDVEKWHRSNTFRLGKQSNLLVSDNQTRFYETANEETQIVHSLTSWGANAVSLPRDFPNLKVHFNINNYFERLRDC